MNTIFPASEVAGQLDALGVHLAHDMVNLCGTKEPWSYPDLIVGAIPSRESSISNIVGDGGHGRGHLQIDDRFWLAWLHQQPAVIAHTWNTIAPGHNAGEAGYVPSYVNSIPLAIVILKGNYQYAVNRGVPQADAAHVMVAAYNCGPASAVEGWRQGDVDGYTANGNYSRDVFERQTAAHAWLLAHQLVD